MVDELRGRRFRGRLLQRLLENAARQPHTAIPSRSKPPAEALVLTVDFVGGDGFIFENESGEEKKRFEWNTTDLSFENCFANEGLEPPIYVNGKDDVLLSLLNMSPDGQVEPVLSQMMQVGVRREALKATISCTWFNVLTHNVPNVPVINIALNEHIETLELIGPNNGQVGACKLRTANLRRIVVSGHVWIFDMSEQHHQSTEFVVHRGRLRLWRWESEPGLWMFEEPPT